MRARASAALSASSSLFPADERRAADLADVDAVARAGLDGLVRGDRLRLAFRVDRLRLPVLDRPLGCAIGRLVDEDAVGGRGRLQPRGGVDDVAGGHALALLGPGVEAHERLAGGDANADVKLPRLVGLVQLGDRLAYGERCPDGPLGVVLARRRRAEDRHHGVADELLHRAAVALELEAHALVIAGEDRPHVFGIELLGLRGEADEVGEEDGDDLALLLRARGLGRERCRARIAEAGAVGVLLAATRAGDHCVSLSQLNSAAASSSV